METPAASIKGSNNAFVMGDNNEIEIDVTNFIDPQPGGPSIRQLTTAELTARITRTWRQLRRLRVRVLKSPWAAILALSVLTLGIAVPEASAIIKTGGDASAYLLISLAGLQCAAVCVFGMALHTALLHEERSALQTHLQCLKYERALRADC